MQRVYQGKYYDFDEKGNESPFAFRMDVDINDKLSFMGAVWEEEFTRISGKKLSVKGYIDGDHISFVKQYPCHYGYDENGKVFVDDTQRGHDVIYDGYWDEERGIWSGEWEVEGELLVFNNEMIQSRVYIGKFEMHMVE